MASPPPHARGGAPPGRAGRVAVILAAGLATLAALAAGWFAAVTTAVLTCGGDGGMPYAARASTQGRFCTSDVSTAYVWAEAVLPVACVVVAGVLATVRRRWRILGGGVGLAVLLVVLMPTVIGSLSSECDGDPGTAECETY